MNGTTLRFFTHVYKTLRASIRFSAPLAVQRSAEVKMRPTPRETDSSATDIDMKSKKITVVALETIEHLDCGNSSDP